MAFTVENVEILTSVSPPPNIFAFFFGGSEEGTFGDLLLFPAWGVWKVQRIGQVTALKSAQTLERQSKWADPKLVTSVLSFITTKTIER